MIGLGPAAPREFVAETIATDTVLRPAIDARQGGVARVEAGIPGLRAIREGRRASGRGWLGYTPRGAYLTADVRILSLVPAWLFLMLAAGLTTWAWLREGTQLTARRVRHSGIWTLPPALFRDDVRPFGPVLPDRIQGGMTDDDP